MNRALRPLLIAVALALIAADSPKAPIATNDPAPLAPTDTEQASAASDDPALLAAIEKIHGVRASTWRSSKESQTVIRFISPGSADMASAMPLLQKLHNVRFLNASSVATDDLLECVKNWPLLEGLDLSVSKNVTDKGLRNLRGLKHLTRLNLSVTSIGDSEVEQIGSLKALVDLDLHQTQITDAGMRHLAGLSALQKLSLALTRISDKGLEPLARLENLQSLDLSSTEISDAGLESLSHLRNLQDLDLGDDDITDVGVAKLKPLPRLRSTSASGEHWRPKKSASSSTPPEASASRA